MVLEKIAAVRPDVVIMDANWIGASVPTYYVGPDYMAHLATFVGTLLEKGAKSVFVMGQIPTWKNSLPAVLTRKFVMRDRAIPERTYEGVLPVSLEMDARMRAVKFPAGATYLSMKDVLCNESGCLTSVGPNLETDLTVWDYGHLTPKAAEYVCNALFGKLPLFQ
jgi:hypothetical protein